MLTKAQIFEVQDVKIEKVTIPEWNGHVFVRSMTSRERDDWETGYSKDKSNMRATFAARTVCDEAGGLIFTDGDIEDLGRRSASALSRIFDVASRLNGYGKQDIEELEKN